MANSFVTNLGQLLLLSSVIIGIAGIANYALRRRTAELRRFNWVIALSLLLFIPPAARWFPKFEFTGNSSQFVPEVIVTAIDRINYAPRTTTESESVPLSQLPQSDTSTPFVGAPARNLWLYELIGSLYFLVASLLLARLIACHWKTRVRARNLKLVVDDQTRALVIELAEQIGIGREIRILEEDGQVSPWTWGAIRPVLVLPEGFGAWQVADQKHALVHEIAHIQRCDFITTLLGKLCIAVYWFQPLVWFADRALRKESEYTCDDKVVEFGASAPDYANQLLGIARTIAGSSIPGTVTSAMAGRPSQFLFRVSRILDPKARRIAMKRSTKLFAVFVGALFALPLILLESKPANSQSRVETVDIQGILSFGPTTEAEFDTVLDFLIESEQHDQARSLIVEWMTAPADSFQGCVLCARLVDWREDSANSGSKRSLFMSALGEVEAIAQSQGQPDLLIRVVDVLAHGDSQSAEDLGTYYLLQARAFGELSDLQQMTAVNHLYKVGQYDAALSLVSGLLEDAASPYYQSQDLKRWISLIESKRTLMSRIEDQISPAQSIATATYEYMPAYKQAPVYSADAAARKADGEVVVQYTVTDTGRTSDFTIVSSTDSIFDQSALASVAGYRYLPRVQNGVPVNVSGVKVKIIYAME